MTLTAVILLLAVAIALMLVEIFFVPGVGIVGIVGLSILIASIFMAYKVDRSLGHYVLAASVVVSIGLLSLALRAKTWRRLSVDTELTSKIANLSENVNIGARGMTITRLNPIGNVKINKLLIEAQSRGGLIDEQTPIEIVTIEGNKVTVKPIEKTTT